ncbi:hypothetical protein N476_21720 [Pseudoalteromonas luteoviolacea H33]|uniref:Chitin-binding type-4 domain-containing protein n=1 Tax=Pseudoalteromonas luteoviolacea H33 TaxID=1365251 RepID=A0A167D733_9GAMM|nr:hypothetical protein N476_21720 [Pseudoalteromonas luteoviolacea H33]KZN73355.1 hypothetical protein N477_23820 [Pseudoalteromonas luteoviolacea H33-S]
MKLLNKIAISTLLLGSCAVSASQNYFEIYADGTTQGRAHHNVKVAWWWVTQSAGIPSIRCEQTRVDRWRCYARVYR